MAKYFTILIGLRGCYMPDSSTEIRCTTRRELKSYLAGEVEFAAGEDLNYRRADVAACAAAAWRRTGGHLADVIPYGSGKKRPFAVQVIPSTRADFLAAQREDAA